MAAFADTGGPTTGVLTIFDSRGVELARGDFSSNATISLFSGAANLRLVLAVPVGQMAPGSTTSGNFLSAILPVDRSGEYVALSPLSTLIDMYMQSHAGVAEPVARARVLAYLGLPAETAVYRLFGTPETLFDPDEFYAAAEAAGGMGPLVKTLVAGIDAGLFRSFPKRMLQLGGDTSLVDDLVGSLTSWAGGKVKGWLMQATGVNDLLKAFGLFDEDKSAAQLAALTDAVNALADRVKALPAAVAYTNRLIELEHLRATMGQWRLFLVTNTASTPANATDLASWSSEVLSSPLLTNFHDLEIGSGPNAPGLISLLSRERPKYYDGHPATTYTQALFSQFEAHRQLQELALSYKIEATHARNAPNFAAAEMLIDEHRIHIKRQRQTYPGALQPLDFVVDRSTGLVWSKRMTVINGYRNIPSILRNTKFRLPTIEELRGLRPDAAARAALPEGERNKSVPQIMRHFGFEPEKNADGTLKDFADLSAHGSSKRPFRILSSTLGGSSGGVQLIRSLDLDTGTEQSEYYDPNAAYYGIPLLLVIKEEYARQPQASRDSALDIYVLSQDPDKRTIQMGGSAGVFDLDAHYDVVTKQTIWRIEGGTPETVHISNGPDDSGLIQFRTEEATGAFYTVTAEYSFVLNDQNGSVFTSTSSMQVQDKSGRGFSSTAGLVLAPAQQTISSYPFTGRLTAFRTTNYGRVISGNDYYYAWASSDPAVTVDQNGNITVSVRPSARKEVRISVRVGVAMGVAYLILLP